MQDPGYKIQDDELRSCIHLRLETCMPRRSLQAKAGDLDIEPSLEHWVLSVEYWIFPCLCLSSVLCLLSSVVRPLTSDL